MTPQQIGTEVRGVIAQTLNRRIEDVPLDARLESGLGIDSMAMIEINVALESKFNVTMPEMAGPAEANLQTVSDVVKLVSKQIDMRRAS